MEPTISISKAEIMEHVFNCLFPKSAYSEQPIFDSFDLVENVKVSVIFDHTIAMKIAIYFHYFLII